MTAVVVEPGPVCRITLDRPEARNAVSSAMIESLRSALAEAAVDPGCRVVVLSGTGKDFCAGADLGELAEARREDAAEEYGRSLEDVLRAIEEQPQPVLASVHGAALGAGCQIAIACDLVVAGADAVFGIPSARLGMVINYENVERLVAAVGPKRASDLLLAGRSVSGEEAERWGLVNRVVHPGTREAVSAVATDVGERIAGLAPLSVSASKRGLRAVLRGLEGARGAEGDRAAEFRMLAAEAFASEDLVEGLAAFRDRRGPTFQGR